MADNDTVFRLRSLDTNRPGKYLLSVFQPVPFGVGKNVFLVDRLRVCEEQISPKYYEGVMDDGTLVVVFPDSFSFMLIHRDQYEVITMEEAKKQMAEAEREAKEEDKHEVEVVSPGRFTHL